MNACIPFAAMSVHALLEIVESKDSYTRRHCQRVAALCNGLCMALHLPDRDRALLTLAASVHDVGKLGVPAAILRRPFPLNETERVFMQEHPALGADIMLVCLTDGREVSEIVRHHHERMDGAGYPDRLDGARVSPLARILACADAADAMMTDRPYRAAMPRSAVADALRQNSGTQFDPRFAVPLADLVGRGA